MSDGDILDLIDNALGDWQMSGDAMRWTAEPEPAPLRSGVRYWAAEYSGTFSFNITIVMRPLRDGFARLHEAFSGASAATHERRMAALEARRTRNTGPRLPRLDGRRR